MRFLLSFFLLFLLISYSSRCSGSPILSDEQRWANQSIISNRSQRSAEGSVPPGGEANSNKELKLEDIENLPFDDLETKTKEGEESLTKLEKSVTEKKNELADKQAEAKEPLENYEAKKTKFEQLDALAKGMNKELNEAVAAYDTAKAASDAADGIFEDWETAKANRQTALEKQQQVAAAPTRQPLAEAELADYNSKCAQFQGKKQQIYDDAVTAKAKAEKTAQGKYDQTEKVVNECTANCEPLRALLNGQKLNDLNTAKADHKAAKDVLALFLECPTKTSALIIEIQQLNAIKSDPTVAETKANEDFAKWDKEVNDPKFAKAQENKETANRILGKKELAKITEEGKAPYTEDQVTEAANKATRAESEWQALEDGKDNYERQIRDLTEQVKDLEKQRAVENERVGMLRDVFARKSLERKPKSGSSDLTIGLSCLGALLFICGLVGAFLFVRSKKKKAGQKPPVSKDTPSSASKNPQQPAEAGAAEKNGNSGQEVPPVPGAASSEGPAASAPGPAGAAPTAEGAPAGAAPEGPPERIHKSFMSLAKLSPEWIQFYLALFIPRIFQVDQLPETDDTERKKKKFVRDNIRKGEVVFMWAGTLVFLSKVNGECWRVFYNGEASPMPSWEHMVFFDPNNPDMTLLKKLHELPNIDYKKMSGLVNRVIVVPMIECRNVAFQLAQFAYSKVMENIFHETKLAEQKARQEARAAAGDDVGCGYLLQQLNPRSWFRKQEKPEPFSNAHFFHGFNKIMVQRPATETALSPSNAASEAESVATAAPLSEVQPEGPPEDPREEAGKEEKSEDSRKDDKDRNSKSDSKKEASSKKEETKPAVVPEKSKEQLALEKLEKLAKKLPKMTVKQREAQVLTIFNVLKELAANNNYVYQPNPDDVIRTLQDVVELFRKQDMVPETKGDTIAYVGDIHGNLDNVDMVFKLLGGPLGDHMKKIKFVFLGDYVDRGSNQLEVILVLFTLKMLYPDNIYLLRGNHESQSVNSAYGYKKVIEDLFRERGEEIYSYFNAVFAMMPIGCRTEGCKNLLCMHGGLPEKQIDANLKLLNEEINRPLGEPCSNPIAKAFTWADPFWFLVGAMRNARGGGTWYFGSKVIQDICRTFSVDGIVRAHQLMVSGFEQFGTQLVSIFTASSYKPERDFNNNGAFLLDIVNLGTFVVMLAPKMTPPEISQFMYFLNLFRTDFHGPEGWTANNGDDVTVKS